MRLVSAIVLFPFTTRAFVPATTHLPRALVTPLQARSTSSSSSKPDNKKRNKKKKAFRRVEPPKPRPRITDYEENRDPWVNDDRLDAPINCEHFETCPGCIVNANVGNVDIVKSAKLFFSSAAVRKKRMDIMGGRKNQHDIRDEDVMVEEADDGFYKVLIPSPVKQWRTQAKLAVAAKSSSWSRDGCDFGLYQRGTHKVLPIPSCEVHHPSINKAVRALEEATAKVGTSAFDENSSEGGLRYVQFQVERTTGRICLTLVWNAEASKQAQPALSRLTKELQRLAPNLWHSMWLHCNDGAGNNIFSRNPNRWTRISGPEFVREPIPVGDMGWLYFTPMAFRQGNMDGFDILANDVARAIPGGSRVCELYAGVGLLGLTALSYHAQEGKTPLVWLRCSDENPANPRCFKRSVDSLPFSITDRGRRKRRHNSKKDDGPITIGDLMQQMEAADTSAPDLHAEEETEQDKVTYKVASAAKALYDGQGLGANVLVVDPPRKGLEDEVLIELCKSVNSYQNFAEDKAMLMIPDHKVNWVNNIDTVIYVSCGFEALARDAEKMLSSQAGWMLESATGYVLFPGSDHVETIAIFKRRL
mmetsp:Transcript_18351/g.25887  ORF Transcript_18351/g.25887 Transcript_18351/m.25887 type:complete len:588 (+) Transcript_18351:91-1854(+)